MINKQFVAIVLAVGLILSIGCAMSQDNYTKEQLDQLDQSGADIGREPHLREQPPAHETDETLGDKLTPVGGVPTTQVVYPNSETSQQLTPSGAAPSGAAPVTGPTIITEVLQPYSIPFDGYKLLSYTGNSSGFSIVSLFIECYNGKDYVGEIDFLSDEYFESIQASNSPLAIATVVHPSGHSTYFMIYYPASRLDEILGILRNEKPLTIWVTAGCGGIGTRSLQPVGGS